MATSFYSRYPGAGGGSSANPSVGTNTATAPTSSTEVGFVDGAGNLQPFSGTSAATGPNVAITSSALPTGGATAANQVTGNNSLASIDSKTPALGQQLAAASSPVVLTAAQITTLTPLTTVTVTQATGTNLHATVDNFPATQPVSGTVTVTQATGTNLHAVIDSGTTIVTQATGTNLHTVVDSGSITVTQATGTNLHTVVDSSALPTGAATSANQATEITSLATIATNTTNAGTPVVSGAVKITGTIKANAPVINQYGTTAITTSAYVQLIASTTAVTNSVHIFDSSGQAMILATGGSGSEVDQYYVPPGGDAFTLTIPASTRVAYKALTANANVSGTYLLVNLLS